MFSFSDADALIFNNAVLANGGALSDTEKGGYNVYRIDSKDNANAWNGDAHLDYPMIGGTVESMVINAQNPGTFDAIAVNTVSGDFTANGWTPNGVDSYFRMGLIASVTLTIQSVALEYYSRTDVAESAIEIGSLIGVTQQIRLFLLSGANNFQYQCYDNNVGQGDLRVADVDSLGGKTASRISANDSRLIKNGVQFGGTQATTGGSQPTVEFYLSAFNNNGVAGNFSTKQCAGAGIYDGLIIAKTLAQYTARQTLNTTLSRQV